MTQALAEVPNSSPDEPRVIRVKPDSDVIGIALQVVETLRKDRRVIVRAIGAGAVNQSVKGVIVGQQKIAALGEEMSVRLGFADVTGNRDTEVSAIVFNCSLV